MTTQPRASSRSLLGIAVILGLLSAVGPFSIDMYLPALPTMGVDLGADAAAVQLTLVAYFAGFGISQLFWGPYSDQVGRRRPVLIGLAIFAVATLGCVFAPSIGWLIALRTVQGIGAAVVMVIPRAVIRDMYTGPDATRLMALVMMVISVSPMLAPLVGSGVIALAGWRAVFGVLLAAAVASMAITWFRLPETLPPAARRPARPAQLMAGAKLLLTDSTFLGLTFVGAFGFASFFVFIAAAPFVYTQAFGLTPTQFSLAFAVNALGFFAASQAAGLLGERFGGRRVVLYATMGFAVFAGLFLIVALAGGATLLVTIGLLVCANACLGLVIPTTMMLALDPHGEIAGLASSLGGTLQMLTGGLAAVIAGPFLDGTVAPMAAAIAACALLALATVLVANARTTSMPQPAE